MSPADRPPEESRAQAAARDLERGRERCRAHAWADAHRLLSRADRATPLAPHDLELLATSAYLVGRDADYRKALERAHLAYADGRDRRRAARCAFWLGFRLWMRGEAGQASGWYARAQRVLEPDADVSAERGYLLVPLTEQCLEAGASADAYAAAARAAELGERFRDDDLIAIARHQQGRARLQQRRLDAGLALLDETMVLVVAGRLSPVVTGLMYCSVVQRCQSVYALDRAREWTAALAEWCDAQPDMVAFSGVCRVHRAEILQLGGAWTEAVAEARRACERAIDQRASAAAYYQLGELHRVRGELALAERAYRTASEHGLEPQPGLALLRLAQGRPGTAAAAIRRASVVTTEQWQRLRLLPACVDILLATGATEEARIACRELDGLARSLDSEVVHALAAQARGAVDLAGGRVEIGLASLLRASEIWQHVGAPHHVAAVRVLIGRAYGALGDDDGCKLELAAARATFTALGAASDLRRVEALLGRAPVADAHGLSPREREVLQLIAAGLTNKAIASRLFVSERTVHRHVSNLFTKLRVSSRAAATAYAYEHQLL